MGANKVCIVGAGVSGMVAAINLARDGYEVLVLEKGSKVGEAPYNPRIDLTPLDKEMTWNYMGLNLDPCFQKLKEWPACVHSRRVMLNPTVYIVERGPRESSLDNYLYKEALRAGVKFEFSHPVQSLADIPDNSIIATGLDSQIENMLEIPFIPMHGYGAAIEGVGKDNVGDCILR